MEQGVQNNTIRTRVVRSEEQILALLDKYEACKDDVSVKEFCEMNDIVETTYYSWQKKYRLKNEVMMQRDLQLFRSSLH